LWGLGRPSPKFMGQAIRMGKLELSGMSSDGTSPSSGRLSSALKAF